MSTATAPRPRPASLRHWVRGVVLLCVAVLVWFGAASAEAAPAKSCSCETTNLKKLTKAADLVHVGVVQSTSTSPDGEEQFQVLAQRLFKGELDSARVTITNPAGASCSFGPVERGDRWLFLTGPDHTTTLCDGTRPLRPRTLARVQKLLGVGERLPAPDPKKAVLTSLEVDEPQEFARLAAPGAAAALLGLLGLAIVGRLSRR